MSARNYVIHAVRKTDTFLLQYRDALAEPISALKKTARAVGDAQLACAIPIDVDDYEESFKVTLCEVTYMWSKGGNFDDVHKKTDLFEGTITRALRRLDELM